MLLKRATLNGHILAIYKLDCCLLDAHVLFVDQVWCHPCLLLGTPPASVLAHLCVGSPLADVYVYVYDWLSVIYFCTLLYSLASYPYHMFFVACFGDDLDENHKLKCV